MFTIIISLFFILFLSMESTLSIIDTEIICSCSGISIGICIVGTDCNEFFLNGLICIIKSSGGKIIFSQQSNEDLSTSGISRQSNKDLSTSGISRQSNKDLATSGISRQGNEDLSKSGISRQGNEDLSKSGIS